MSTNARVKWARGGEATIVSLTNDAVSLVSSVPWPPGARVEAATEDGATLKIKVHGSKKRDDGAFEIVGRPLDMPRALRERLAGA
jgi:hypothetical protein